MLDFDIFLQHSSQLLYTDNNTEHIIADLDVLKGMEHTVLTCSSVLSHVLSVLQTTTFQVLDRPHASTCT